MKRIVALAIILGLSACQEQKESDTKDDSSEDAPSESVGTLEISDEQIETNITLAATHTASVGEMYAPKSMEPGKVAVALQLLMQDDGPQYCQNNPTDEMCQKCGPGGELSGSQQCLDFFGPGGPGADESADGGIDGDDSSQGGSDDNPCKGMEFLECQPTLVRLFVSMGAQSIKRIPEFFSELASHADEFTETKGELPIGDSGEYKIKYRIDSAADMGFLVINAKGEIEQRAVINGQNYSIEDSYDGDLFATEMTYVDEKNWTATTTMWMNECRSDDVRAPSRIQIVMNMVGGVWQGKSMMYSPRWIGENTCDTVPTANTAIGIYQDFVGVDKYTTASLYMIPSSLDTLNANNIATFSFANLCKNFPDFCEGPDAETSAFGAIPENPFCNLDDGTAVWGQKCTAAEDNLVKDGTYSSQDLWTPPGEFVQMPAISENY